VANETDPFECKCTKGSELRRTISARFHTRQLCC
jgi:hypothetical protein